MGLIPNYRITSCHVGLSRRLVTSACHVGSSHSAVSNKQTRGGTNIKLVPLDSAMHGAYITINLDTLPQPKVVSLHVASRRLVTSARRWWDSVLNKISVAYS